MAEEKLKYKSERQVITYDSKDLGIIKENGLEIAWSCNVKSGGYPDYDYVTFNWKFNWDELKKKGIKRLSGPIHMKVEGFFKFEQDVDVDLKKPNQIVKAVMESLGPGGMHVASFEYSLIPHYN